MQFAQTFTQQEESRIRTVPLPDLLRDDIVGLLAEIYPTHDLDALGGKIVTTFWPDEAVPLDTRRQPQDTIWDEKDTYVITYGGTFVDGQYKPLDLLHDFFTHYLKGTISGIHILPYFPFTSDDGFAVTDYCEVNSQLGAWEDISRLGAEFRLMSDLVINHCSSQSMYFNEYLQGHAPYDKFFFEATLADDISLVVRPRAHELLREVETANGPRHVWCTFSHDQIDFNFANPEVLIEFVRILRFHIDRGVRTLRLDAVAFLWKEPGTSSIHLPQTHALIRLLRLLADYNDEPLMLITETNVPNAENLSYFGEGDEAHAIYNFSLPPLLLHALHNGNSQGLNEWQKSMPELRNGCTYFNFTASHDGIGMRPAEGYLSDDQIDEMIATVQSFGGLVSMRRVATGQVRPYEINTSLFDALKGTINGIDDWNIERFLCSQIIAMGLQGIPGFYIHSLLATHNDLDGVEKTGHNRAINRHRWHYPQIRAYLAREDNVHSEVFRKMKTLISLRIDQPAFHPNAGQQLLELDERFFAFRRFSEDSGQTIIALHNLTDQTIHLPLEGLALKETEVWIDLLSGDEIDRKSEALKFTPYQCRWLTKQNTYA